MKGLFRALNRSSLHSTCTSYKSICYGWLYGRLMHCTLHMSDCNLKIFQDSIGFTCCFILASQMQLHHAHSYFLVLEVEALETHIFLHLLWDFNFEFSLASYDNFFPQIRTYSQISTLPDLGHNVKRVSLSESVTPPPSYFTILYTSRDTRKHVPNATLLKLFKLLLQLNQYRRKVSFFVQVLSIPIWLYSLHICYQYFKFCPICVPTLQMLSQSNHPLCNKHPSF